ncbi:MICOS complex subunit MIC19-like isoform X1 [Phasianus colchicus]|uniref:MICOS complex subunit MIC19-like isoform X1 n=1 Tax=Phasianus colchicus TaxID=9054 RepID=UPI00129D5092|nr:MICOS complex subunit MIC19-like isoform X1 [Phasianus colchicus]
MGASGSTRRVTFEADENENITVVKGVRLSDSVIDRMKEPSSPGGRPQSQRRSPGAVNDEELKKRIAEELALERARRDSEAQKRRGYCCVAKECVVFMGSCKILMFS